LTLAYFIICSLRALYDLPTERDANWIFKATVDRRRHDCRTVGLKVMLTMILPWLLLIALPLYAWKWNWQTAALHVAYVMVWSAAFGEMLLIGFRKIPFTCMRVMSKDRVLVMIIFFLLGYSFFSTTTVMMELFFLTRPWWMIALAALFLALIIGIRAVERDMPAEERDLIFEDRPRPSVQVLDLRIH